MWYILQLVIISFYCYLFYCCYCLLLLPDTRHNLGRCANKVSFKFIRIKMKSYLFMGLKRKSILYGLGLLSNTIRPINKLEFSLENDTTDRAPIKLKNPAFNVEYNLTISLTISKLIYEIAREFD